MKTLDGERPDKQQWGADVRVSQHAANEWEPSLAYDRGGNLWVAYDSYRAGNYDVFLTKVAGGTTRGDEIAVAASPRFEARATVAIDGADRVWVAWEEGLAGWGKDQGYILRDRKTGVPLGGVRRPRIRCYDAGQPRDTEDSLEQAFAGAANTYQPHVFADPKGGVWVVAKSRRNIPDPTPVNPNRVTGYFEYASHAIRRPLVVEGAAASEQPGTFQHTCQRRSSLRWHSTARLAHGQPRRVVQSPAAPPAGVRSRGAAAGPGRQSAVALRN